MKPLELRKQLLIAESELNRAQLIEQVVALSSRVHGIKDRAKSFGSLASSAAVLLAGLAALKRNGAGAADAKPSWLKTALKGAGLVSTFWLAFRAQRREQPDKSTDQK